MAIVEITTGNKDSFKESVLKSDKLIVLDFWAPTCEPCLRMAPELASLAEEMDEEFQLVKVNIDEFPDLAIGEYKVLGIPTLIAFKGGTEKERIIGYKPKEEIKAFIQKNL